MTVSNYIYTENNENMQIVLVEFPEQFIIIFQLFHMCYTNIYQRLLIN